MSERTFETLTAGDLQTMSGRHWEDALAALNVPVLEAEEDRTGIALTLSTDLPYRASMDRYTNHLETCERCQGDWLNQCPTGDRLATFAADAMAAQDDLAGQN